MAHDPALVTAVAEALAVENAKMLPVKAESRPTIEVQWKLLAQAALDAYDAFTPATMVQP